MTRPDAGELLCWHSAPYAELWWKGRLRPTRSESSPRSHLPHPDGLAASYGMKRMSLIRALTVLGLAIATAGTASATQPSEAPPRQAATSAQIRQLIENLGDPSYAERVRARAELERLGLIALDAIRAAEDSEDNEIAHAARFLMSSLEVRWSKESDPLPVRQILSEYGAQTDTERKTRMDQLAGLPDRQGLPALARLARFERNLRLSRFAALLAITPDDQQAPPTPSEAAMIRETIGDSERAAAEWLLQYARDVESGGYDADAWQRLIAQERLLVDEDRSHHTDSTVLLELYRVSAVRALGDEQRDEAMRLAADSLDSVMPRRQDLMNAVAWALDTELYPIVLELQDRQSQRFEEEPELLYAVAEAHESMEQEAMAEKYRLRALGVHSLPPQDTPAASQLSPNEIEQRALRRREIGRVLENRGRFDWAEGEYRHVIERLPIDSLPAAVVRSQLATLLGDLEKHQDVVEVLEPLVERLEQDSAFRTRYQQQVLLSPDYFSSKLLYHRAKLVRGEEARAALRKSLEKDPDNADVLIAMHRHPGDAAWEAETRTAIERVSRRFQLIIQQLEQAVREGRGDIDAKLRLATACNEYAWLVSNTEGDVAKALRASLRSVELMPHEAAFLDTLGRCYYANGEIDRAIASQRRALRIEPHAAPLQRQMEFFLAERKAAPKPTNAAADEVDPAKTPKPATEDEDPAESEETAESGDTDERADR